MSAVAAPPDWVLAIPLDPGAWRLLVALWTFANFKASGPCPVWPKMPALRKRCGNVNASALYKQLDKLTALGWIRDHDGEDGGWVLAWESPFPVESPSVQGKSPDGDTDSPSGVSPSGVEKSPDGESKVSKWRQKSLQVENRSKEDLTRDLTTDLAGPRSAGGRDPVDRELDALLTDADPRQALHRAIVEQQAQLERERAANREAQARSPEAAVTAEYIAAVRAAGDAWALVLERDAGRRRWLGELGAAIVELGLTPALVRVVLAGWDADAERHSVKAIEGEQVPDVPPRRFVFHPRRRAWLVAKLGTADGVRKREAGSKRSSAPLGCDWSEGADKPEPLSMVERLRRKQADEAARQGVA